MTETRTPLSSQSDTARALLALIDQYPDLPAASFDVQPDSAIGRLGIHLHNDPAGLEMWREALNLDPETGDLHQYSDFSSVTFRGDLAGIPVRLVGYLPLPLYAAA